jgi:hypothetical protein
VRELEAQGVRRNVVADMFGLALRSYQLKFQRALDSASVQRSLWREVYDLLAAGAVTRKELESRLPTVDPKSLSAVLNDLVDSGLAYSSGRGQRAVFGLTPEQDLVRVTREEDDLSLSEMFWLQLATRGPLPLEALSAEMGVSPERAEAALERLLRDGRAQRQDDTCEALSFDIPVGADRGWEAAVCDHFRAVATAIGAKLKDAQSRSDDRIGGTTLSFTVYEGHPQADEIYSLLQRFRRELDALWETTSRYNAEHPVSERADRVTFYFGQNVGSGAISCTKELGTES